MGAKDPKSRSGGKGGRLLHFKKNGRDGVPVYWDIADAEQVLDAIAHTTRLGAAIIFGRTSDGGALSICILDDDGKAHEYPHNEAEVRDALGKIISVYTED